MGLILGIDVGSTTTKIVGLDSGKIISPMFITAADPITSLFGAFGKYIYDNKIKLEDIEHVMITGVGSAQVSTPIYGLPTTKVDEFVADGRDHRPRIVARAVLHRIRRRRQRKRCRRYRHYDCEEKAEKFFLH